uniref:Uncharacterized protein n=1 Tax=Glossina austeni TaxID=7395 RepID=A0A1A9UTQ3_GLOAU
MINDLIKVGVSAASYSSSAVVLQTKVSQQTFFVSLPATYEHNIEVLTSFFLISKEETPDQALLWPSLQRILRLKSACVGSALPNAKVMNERNNENDFPEQRNDDNLSNMKFKKRKGENPGKHLFKSVPAERSSNNSSNGSSTTRSQSNMQEIFETLSFADCKSK